MIAISWELILLLSATSCMVSEMGSEISFAYVKESVTSRVSVKENVISYASMMKAKVVHQACEPCVLVMENAMSAGSARERVRVTSR